MHRNELATAWLSKAIQINPDYLEPYLSLGSLLQNTGRNIEAIDVYESYLESHAGERRILSNLALAYSNAGRADDAVSTLQAALAIDPDDEMLNLYMAEHLLMLGRKREAGNFIAKARKLDKENPMVDVSGLINMLERQNTLGGNILRSGKVVS
jgi:tetratricopeptide (TPR) repeat protein